MSQSNNPYQSENVALYEALYGHQLISLGGLDAIDNMFNDFDLSNLNLLDIGFGLGGVMFYLAEKYDIKISGVEIQNWMIEYAKKHAPKQITSQLTFAMYNQSVEIPFQNTGFDLVYSKGVLNHVRNKEPLFLEINRVLKKDGWFVIADWIHPAYFADSENPLVNETQISYQAVLEKTGYIDINFRDDSALFLTYVKKLLANINSRKNQIQKNYGSEMLTRIQDDHQMLIADLDNKKKSAVRIRAKKK